MIEFYLYTCVQLVCCKVVGSFMQLVLSNHVEPTSNIYSRFFLSILYLLPFAFFMGYIWQTYLMGVASFCLLSVRHKDPGKYSWKFYEVVQYLLLLLYFA